MSVPGGWTEVTNGQWGVGQPRFPDNVPVGVHYTNEFQARGVETPEGVFKIEGIATETPNAGKPDGLWWDYVAGEHDQPTNFEPWVEAASAAPAVPEIPAPEPETPASDAPAAEPEASAPAPQPSLTIQKNADGRWEVRAAHATGEVITEAWDTLAHAMHNTWRWVTAHLHL